MREDLDALGGDQASLDDQVHLRFVGAGEDISRRALHELGSQGRRAGEVQQDLRLRIISQESIAQRLEDIGERSGREDGQAARIVLGAAAYAAQQQDHNDDERACSHVALPGPGGQI